MTMPPAGFTEAEKQPVIEHFETCPVCAAWAELDITPEEVDPLLEEQRRYVESLHSSEN